jgi:hypothetical protein
LIGTQLQRCKPLPPKGHHIIGVRYNDVTKVKEPKVQALFETTAEVLIGLQKDFSDYEEGNEPAWRPQ